MLILHDLVCKHWAIIVLFLDGEVYLAKWLHWLVYKSKF